ncbi:ribonuclease H2 subunit A isoform X2 [Neocloeon triangulifer]|nr:ribonuclease H2 subunit A isoform X2 [Neocloeon triangulifer]
MVYGICYCPLAYESELKALGAVDSKSIDEKKREEMFEKLCKHPDQIGWSVEVISPTTISNDMLRRSKISLNELSHNAAIQLVQRAIEDGANIKEVYVDTVGPPEKYQDKLSKIFPDIKVTVAKKADATYPIVSAASICAKVCRDKAVHHWKFKENVQMNGDAWGSGYPADPVTKKFLQENIDSIFGFPQLVRFSWSTADKIIEEKCVTVEWSDDEDEGAPKKVAKIQSFFSSSNAAKQPQLGHKFFTERKLKRATDLF